MKIRIWPQKDGTSKVYFQRTRPSEGRNRLLLDVKPEDFKTSVEKEIRAMRGESAVESP